jgi:hypothetical protein
MDDRAWKQFFDICASVLGGGEANAVESASWCSWTTYQRLNEDARYWAAGLPKISEIGEAGIRDGGTWGQSFPYAQLAHIIIPKEFFWESSPGPNFSSGKKSQDLDGLSKSLAIANIDHRKTNLVVEIKLF